MSPGRNKFRYKVLPLPKVQREAKKLLTPEQLHEGIQLAKRLRRYPDVADLSIERLGEGMELRVDTPSIGAQGWLRVVFWVHNASKTMYVVDLFWKKTNAISTADRIRADHRIRLLKKELAGGQNPWRLAK
jgi:phage-related protein